MFILHPRGQHPPWALKGVPKGRNRSRRFARRPPERVLAQKPTCLCTNHSASTEKGHISHAELTGRPSVSKLCLYVLLEHRAADRGLKWSGVDPPLSSSRACLSRPSLPTGGGGEGGGGMERNKCDQTCAGIKTPPLIYMQNAVRWAAHLYTHMPNNGTKDMCLASIYTTVRVEKHAQNRSSFPPSTTCIIQDRATRLKKISIHVFRTAQRAHANIRQSDEQHFRIATKKSKTLTAACFALHSGTIKSMVQTGSDGVSLFGHTCVQAKRSGRRSEALR